MKVDNVKKDGIVEKDINLIMRIDALKKERDEALKVGQELTRIVESQEEEFNRRMSKILIEMVRKDKKFQPLEEDLCTGVVRFIAPTLYGCLGFLVLGSWRKVRVVCGCVWVLDPHCSWIFSWLGASRFEENEELKLYQLPWIDSRCDTRRKSYFDVIRSRRRTAASFGKRTAGGDDLGRLLHEFEDEDLGMREPAILSSLLLIKKQPLTPSKVLVLGPDHEQEHALKPQMKIYMDSVSYQLLLPIPQLKHLKENLVSFWSVMEAIVPTVVK
ncbi:hypothetical protein LWI28_000361 [Acer negundo]|uniref:Uncharacterized protein n=1 Tax=Acer negundo TaxID=4023 RepID=A0AAD5NRS9_ACENE|nr:hypothetical protein LWI28_000361 [Acer negundo]